MPGLLATTLRMLRLSDLVGIDAGLFDDRTPFVDFSLEMCAQRRRRRSVLSDRFGAQFGESLLDVIVL